MIPNTTCNCTSPEYFWDYSNTRWERENYFPPRRRVSLWSKETFRHIPNSVIPVVTAWRQTQRSQPQVTATTHTCSVLRLLGLESGVNVHSVMRKHYSELPPGHCPVCPPSSHRESGHSDKDLGSGFPPQVPRGAFYNNHLTFSPDKRDLCYNRVEGTGASTLLVCPARR